MRPLQASFILANIVTEFVHSIKHGTRGWQPGWQPSDAYQQVRRSIKLLLHGFQSKYAAAISFIAQNSSRVSWWVSDRPKRLLNAISRNVSWSMNRETDGSVVVGIAFSNEHLFNKYIIIYQSTKMMNDFPFCPSSVGDNIIHIVSSCWALSPYHFNMYEKGKIYIDPSWTLSLL